MKNGITVALLAGSAALLTGCNRGAPAGQVAAVVNGKDVTLQEVNTELQAANVPPTADKQQVQSALLQQVIDRKLLIQAAHDAGIDKTPEFLAQKRRAEELLLAQAYAKQQLANVPVPTSQQVDAFMAAHPNGFGKREVLKIDQIRMARPSDPKVLQALQNDHTLDAVGATLTKLGVKFDRGGATLDTGTVPTALIQQIDKLPAGEPFVVPVPQGVAINVVTGRETLPFDAAKARPAATAAWRQETFAGIIKGKLDALKGNAKITYQNGFAPPAAPKPGAPAAPAAAPAAS